MRPPDVDVLPVRKDRRSPALRDDLYDALSLGKEQGVLTNHERRRSAANHFGERGVDARPLGRLVDIDLNPTLLAR
jgi:hypothetical protein